VRDSKENGVLFSIGGASIIWFIDWAMLEKRISPDGVIMALWLGT